MRPVDNMIAYIIDKSTMLKIFLSTLLAIHILVATASAAKADSAFGLDGPVDVTIHSSRDRGMVPPGAVGWGAMWKRNILWPTPPPDFTDQSHAQYIEMLGKANLPLIKAADVRNISWPWGVSFSTYAVNWENSACPWSRRKVDCARILGRTAPWCEKTIVGVGDLLRLAEIWNLEAVTVSVPLAVIDGSRTRWGPGFIDHSFSRPTIEKISDHARQLVEYMKAQPAWNKLQIVYLSAGCEWRHYGLKNPSPAVLTYAELVKAIRRKVTDSKVIVVACASDGADIPGKRQQTASWNRYLYEQLNGVPGVALDLHRYRGMEGAVDSGKSMPLNRSNTDVLLLTGLRQRGFLTVRPEQWGETGPAMNTVLLENAIHGINADHSKHGSRPRPWPVSMAHADLAREALSSGALTFLSWTWFPEDLPPEWPHGALGKDGRLKPHAVAQAFLSKFHRGTLLDTSWTSEKCLRGNAVRFPDGSIRLYGGNFSPGDRRLTARIEGTNSVPAEIEIMSDNLRVSRNHLNSGESIVIPALSLFRVRFDTGRE